MTGLSKRNLKQLFREQIPFFLSIPSLIWQILFFYIPTILIIGLSFVAMTGYGFTLYNYWLCCTVTYAFIIARSLLAAFITSFCCVLIAYPVCYYLALSIERAKNFLLFLLILPFWTSVMVQIYAWFFVLERHGLINTILLRLHLITQPVALLNSSIAVYIVMIYCYLPFMIMPLYAQLEKLDTRLLDASADLGATAWQTFTRITLPLSVPGIRTGFFLVLVPSFGELAIPALLSGGKQLFVGSVISQFFISAREPHLGAAFTVMSCIALAAAVGLMYMAFSWFSTPAERNAL